MEDLKRGECCLIYLIGFRFDNEYLLNSYI